ncbi:SRPBCC domain-containing protein [Actinospica sp.]|jgi:uncharacterized protein YndB with AHSA1/START domain|uniref:SRPBCC domain-containing protein n=1 Tax=Actinospica sp. TaxID=1872142 RepID=UPI002C2E653D|nr:SRPBCC domain-containing protein [Actinospica sp.]HWG27583.1 SRPBCC domain-containing protein [Actinospica sp.]
MTEHSVTHSTFVLERIYDAAPERVFAAWGDPVAKNRWFAAVEDGSAPTMEVDFRVGGTERNVFVSQDGGPTFTYEAVFRDIVPNERIVMTNHMHRDSDSPLLPSPPAIGPVVRWLPAWWGLSGL